MEGRLPLKLPLPSPAPREGRRTFDLRHLNVFRAVMRAGTVTGAGVLLGVTQPAVSSYLHQTEELAGFALFERIQGRLVPTSKATLLYAESERLLAGVEQIAAMCRRLRDEAIGPIVIASVPTLTLVLLPKVVKRWQDSGTLQPMIVHSRMVGSVLALVSARRADLCLVTGVPKLPGLRTKLLARTPWVCAMAPDHPLAARAVVRLADLQGERFIAGSREEARQPIIDQMLEAAGVWVREVMECPLGTAAAAMAAEGIGVTITDAFNVQPSRERLVLRPFEPRLTTTCHLVWNEGVQATFDRPRLATLVHAEVRTMLKAMMLPEAV